MCLGIAIAEKYFFLPVGLQGKLVVLLAEIQAGLGEEEKDRVKHYVGEEQIDQIKH